MLTISKNANLNYLAKVVKIDKLIPINGADRIQSTTVDFQNVIVSKDVEVGDLMVYFPIECEISHDFISKANLYRKSLELNKNSKDSGGFIEKHRRIKAIRLMGVRSQGFLCSEALFNDIYPSIMLDNFVGAEFDSVNKSILLKKYEAPIKIHQTSNKRKKQQKIPERIIDKTVYLHVDTLHLRKHVHKIIPETIVSISSKWHGSSAVFTNVPVKRPLKIREKISRLFGVVPDNKFYDIVYCSRNVVKNRHLYPNSNQPGHYYSEDIWKIHAEKLAGKIPKGYTLYGEIVGYTSSGAGIQGKYDYGCPPKESKFVCYRMTHNNFDGQVWNVTTPEAKAFCDSVNIDFVPLYYHGPIGDYVGPKGYKWDDVRDFREDCVAVLEARHNNHKCNFCSNNVPAEGITIRVEGNPWEFQIYKLKSSDFLEYESKQLDKIK